MKENGSLHPARIALWILILFINCGQGTEEPGCRPKEAETLTKKKAREYLARSQAFLESRAFLLQQSMDKWATETGLSENYQQELDAKLATYYQNGVSQDLLDALPYDPEYSEKYGVARAEVRYAHAILFRHIFGENHPKEEEYLILSSKTNFNDDLAGDLYWPLLGDADRVFSFWKNHLAEMADYFEQLQNELPNLFTPEELSKGWGRWYDHREEVDLFDLIYLDPETPVFCFQESEFPVMTYDLISARIYLWNAIPRENWSVHFHPLEVLFEPGCSRDPFGLGSD